MNTPKWHVLQNTLGQWFWHKKSGNGEITATAQSFASKQGAMRAVTRDAYPWFCELKYDHAYILSEMLLVRRIVIHPAQKRLRVEDLKVGMQVMVKIDSGYTFDGHMIKVNGEWAVDYCGYSMLTRNLRYLSKITSVTEVTK